MNQTDKRALKALALPSLDALATITSTACTLVEQYPCSHKLDGMVKVCVCV